MVSGENHARRKIDLGRHSRGEQTEIDDHMKSLWREERKEIKAESLFYQGSLRRIEKHLSPIPKDIHSWVEGCELEQWRGLLREKMESCFQENEEQILAEQKTANVICRL